MKAKLVYQLPEDNFDFSLASKATDMYLTLSDLRNHLKREQDLAEDKGEEEKANAIESIRKYFWELLQEKELVNLIDS
jgi:hypothetical protein